MNIPLKDKKHLSTLFLKTIIENNYMYYINYSKKMGIYNEEESNTIIIDTAIKVNTYILEKSKLHILSEALAYFTRTLKNTIFNAIKRKKYLVFEEQMAIHSNSFIALDQDERLLNSQDIFNVIDDVILNEKHLEIIKLKYQNGYSNQEIGEEMTMKLGTVKSSLHNSLSKLKSSVSYDSIISGSDH